MRRLLLYALLLLVIGGCVHYDEELWINRDGSGRAKIRLVHRSQYDNPEEILNKANLPEIHLQKYDIERIGRNVVYTVHFKFANVEAFNNINDRLGAADFWGKITLNKGNDRTILFKRRISLGSLEGEDDLEFLFREQMEKSPVWSYKLHVPWKIVSANALSENIDHKSKSITWQYDTGYMWNKTQYMTVEMRKELPWFVFVLGFLAIILIIISIIWLFKIARRSHLLDWI
ncbi:MAG: hypothetical protein U1C33_02050, partial [Candidatus Cloacimonadaceae bacterium]|nr:hypothetical protein [Candidatus Cloacimonadaceae bacterium]